MKNKIAMLIATWFYSSMIFKAAPGTWGTFFSLPLCWAALYLSKDYSSFNKIFLISFLAIILFLIGLWSVPIAEKILKKRRDGYGETVDRDQGQIVIDETLGILVASAPIFFITIWGPFLDIFLAFILFRLFDIIKITPAKYFDNMKSPFGVMMDDVVAGAQAAIIFYGLYKLIVN